MFLWFVFNLCKFQFMYVICDFLSLWVWNLPFCTYVLSRLRSEENLSSLLMSDLFIDFFSFRMYPCLLWQQGLCSGIEPRSWEWCKWEGKSARRETCVFIAAAQSVRMCFESDPYLWVCACSRALRCVWHYCEMRPGFAEADSHS